MREIAGEKSRVLTFRLSRHCGGNFGGIEIARGNNRGKGIGAGRGHLAVILPPDLSPQGGGFTRDLLGSKSKSPLFPGGRGQRLQMTSA